MSKMRILLIWNEAEDKWHMLKEENGRFIQEFYDCENINSFFQFLDKDFIQAYEIDSKLLYVSHISNKGYLLKEKEDDQSGTVVEGTES